MAFYTAGLTTDQWMWCVFLGLGSLLWGQVHSYINTGLGTCPVKSIPAGSFTLRALFTGH